MQLPPKLQSEEDETTWQKVVTASDALITIDLFCGTGGPSYGFQEAGFVNAIGIDSDADACETHSQPALQDPLSRHSENRTPSDFDGGTQHPSC